MRHIKDYKTQTNEGSVLRGITKGIVSVGVLIRGIISLFKLNFKGIEELFQGTKYCF